MLWEKKSQVPLPNPVLGATPLLKPISDNPVKETMIKTSESVASDLNHSLLGSSFVLKGDLSGDEDLLIDGQFDGTINLRERCLTVGAQGQVKAGIQAARVIINGSVTGNISARERIDIRKTGRVLGDLVAPGISIEDGAYFKGSIEILREEKQPAGRGVPEIVTGQGSTQTVD